MIWNIKNNGEKSNYGGGGENIREKTWVPERICGEMIWKYIYRGRIWVEGGQKVKTCLMELSEKTKKKLKGRKEHFFVRREKKRKEHWSRHFFAHPAHPPKWWSCAWTGHWLEKRNNYCPPISTPPFPRSSKHRLKGKLEAKNESIINKQVIWVELFLFQSKSDPIYSFDGSKISMLHLPAKFVHVWTEKLKMKWLMFIRGCFFLHLCDNNNLL